ncbi:3,4-dihydroxyphenylacetate 2,3-dioxygenase [Oceanospirillum multiglobuliferum]|uniref:3,4-dihydroxyphenylacetate 2,3-dioxygenase n=1 Tax=Oceanospirillum multiglobuliferum TaxID=64969 RepID=A0A1T4QMW5_9GAMM|nr:3,4-dihydroxyphenylacetate 2,3-dioxygenase [Oceanospirillum multiglobuliferum]OPX56432.1 3,4-dihydroxyphenylacetate 2,3-dioxygenase [Oceanospirillum multiglobuliferum]SKA04598.1 3,4-dihydroxyphenylacetate 2,3-dioxygenase [Oceanospirillum multiglobuliferum]
MGEITIAAKVTHVPTMLLSEQPGNLQGCRQPAIDGHRELGRRAREAGVDTVIVLDTHWLVNAGFHINSNESFEGVYTSHEFPHFIQNLNYKHKGNPALGDAIAKRATEKGVHTLSHQVPTLDLEYGTLVPLQFMDPEGHFKVVSIAAWCTVHSLKDSRVLGEAIAEAIRESDSKVMLLASGSLSHKIWENELYAENNGTFTISREFNRQVDLRVMDLWEQGEYATFLKMLPEYAQLCAGEGGMHDTAMLFGALGWDQYKGKAEVITPYFPSSGTGQTNVQFHL